MNLRWFLGLTVLWAAAPAVSLAQTDEIQVYDATIAEPGANELTLHANTTPAGRKDAEFPGGVVPDHSTNGAFEWAHGVMDAWELGLYLPVYTITNRGDPQLDGFKLRSLFVSPHAQQRTFFYGINFELSYNVHHWESTRAALEIRPIAGWHIGQWDVILNPILDSDFKGIGAVHFAPAERVAYNLPGGKWALALEHYSDVGPLQQLDGVTQQQQMLYAVVDRTIDKSNSIEFGGGHGFTAASDDLVVKFIWNHRF